MTKLRVASLAIVSSICGAAVVGSITYSLVSHIKTTQDWDNGVPLDEIPMGANLSNYYLVYDKSQELDFVRNNTINKISFDLFFNDFDLFHRNSEFKIRIVSELYSEHMKSPNNQQSQSMFMAYNNWNEQKIFYSNEWNDTNDHISGGHGQPWIQGEPYFQLPSKAIVISATWDQYCEDPELTEHFIPFLHHQKIYKHLPPNI